jgi:hypothetical protein
MTKAQLLEALEPFNDDDHLELEEMAIAYTPRIRRICGKSMQYMPHYCCREPGHKGACYCKNKGVHFTPEE